MAVCDGRGADAELSDESGWSIGRRSDSGLNLRFESTAHNRARVVHSRSASEIGAVM
ncbi:hypothetical protein PLANPX_1876 [Lacipirellula parvula]|uniref:Uncharacterized protein n=1 Tax=Lacipirellula parvula TaxID=2650471 RepID=A0A5K7X6B7_9BACT|nr:hypothetical protein PLANPX_1876 [Lacipirellula parvula]